MGNKYSKAGYVTDQKGILNRYYREFDNWQNHIENSKRHILSFAANINAKNIAILGSGWLIDVPVNYFIDNNYTVSMFDINHPRAVLNRYKKYSNISFVNADLTFGLVDKAVSVKRLNEFLEFIEHNNFNNIFLGFDMVVSVNLLNQLDILLCDYLIKKFNPGPQIIDYIRQIVQTQHIKSLPATKSLIISDVEEFGIDKNNQIAYTKNLVYTDTSLLKCIDNWDWVFDTHRYYNNKYATTFKVKCFIV